MNEDGPGASPSYDALFRYEKRKALAAIRRRERDAEKLMIALCDLYRDSQLSQDNKRVTVDNGKLSTAIACAGALSDNIIKFREDIQAVSIAHTAPNWRDRTTDIFMRMGGTRSKR